MKTRRLLQSVPSSADLASFGRRQQTTFSLWRWQKPLVPSIIVKERDTKTVSNLYLPINSLIKNAPSFWDTVWMPRRGSAAHLNWVEISDRKQTVARCRTVPESYTNSFSETTKMRPWRHQTVEWLEIVSSIINNHGITRKDMICFQKWVNHLVWLWIMCPHMPQMFQKSGS